MRHQCGPLNARKHAQQFDPDHHHRSRTSTTDTGIGTPLRDLLECAPEAAVPTAPEHGRRFGIHRYDTFGRLQPDSGKQCVITAGHGFPETV
jgi:hypothetical protein